MVTFGEFVKALLSNRLLAVSMALVLGTIFVNGATDAAIALQGGVAGVNWAEWSKVIWGLALSLTVGLFLGFVISRLLRWTFAELANRQANTLFSRLQVVGAGFGAFMHGAQDGQKFLSTAMLAVMLSTGQSPQSQTSYPVWLMVLCASVLSLGVASGGSKIVATVGTKVVKMVMYQGAAASLSAALSLLMATVFGPPVSTTNTKTAQLWARAARRTRTWSTGASHARWL